LQGHCTRSQRTRGGHRVEAGDGTELALERAGHSRRHRFWIGARQTPTDTQGWEVDAWQVTDLKRGVCKHAKVARSAISSEVVTGRRMNRNDRFTAPLVRDETLRVRRSPSSPKTRGVRDPSVHRRTWKARYCVRRSPASHSETSHYILGIQFPRRIQIEIAHGPATTCDV